MVEAGTFNGEPPAGSPLAASLRAFSDFTATSQEMVVLDAAPAATVAASSDAGSAPGSGAPPPPAQSAPAPAPVDPGIQMWNIREAKDRWRQPPISREVFTDFRQGAIDFWVQYDPTWVAEETHGTLVAYSNGYETVFEVGMAAGGDGIVMSNGKRDDYGQVTEQSNIVPADFTDGLIHHVALVTEGDSTDVFVDGQQRGVASVGYALAEDASGPKTNLQLSIGSLDGRRRVFQGKVGGVRIWGAPLPGEALFRAAFLRDSELAAVPWADSFLVAQLENVAGRTSKPALRFLPPLYLPAGIWMVPTEAERKQTKPGATLKDIDWTFQPQRYVQLVVAAPDSELARFAGAGGGSAAPGRPDAKPATAVPAAGGSPLAVSRPSEAAAIATVPVLVWLEFQPFESNAKPETVVAKVFRPAGRNRYTSPDGRQLALSSRIYLGTGSETLQRFDVADRPPRPGQPRIRRVHRRQPGAQPPCRTPGLGSDQAEPVRLFEAGGR